MTSTSKLLLSFNKHQLLFVNKKFINIYTFLSIVCSVILMMNDEFFLKWKEKKFVCFLLTEDGSCNAVFILINVFAGAVLCLLK